MFAGIDDLPSGTNLPVFETRKALIIINLQNDSLYVKDDLYITKNRDFVTRLKDMIPYFRKHGDIVWVKTHLGALPSPPARKSSEELEKESAKLADKNKEAQHQQEQQMQPPSHESQACEKTATKFQLDPIDPNAGPGNDYPAYYPSSKTKAMMMQASAETRAEKRSADLQVFDDKDNNFEKHLSKPRKGQQARFYIAGTKGAAICDQLLDVVDESQDLIVTKHHYSSFDQTSLLTALRAKLVTEVYLCGCLTNVGVYSTAADAVQHGLQVTVVEDCLGYRSEEKHEEAMRQMAEIMGVHGIDSEEIIEESGGRPVPDAETPGITLDELSINSPRIATMGLPDSVGPNLRSQLVSGRQTGQPVEMHSKPDSPVAQSMPDTQQGSSSKKDLFEKNRPTVDGDDSGKDSSPAPSSTKNRRSWNLSRTHALGPNDKIGSGDSRIIYNVLETATVDLAFRTLKDEIGWQTMLHRSGQVPRLVAVQGEIGPAGEIPVYRHPADESPPLLPFTPMIQRIRHEVEAELSQTFNHALIQLYRGGIDNISEHSDKTLDIVRGSFIVNVSLGAQRAMTLRTKKSKHRHGVDSPSMRQSQRIEMPHNSVFVLGPQTNREWLHGVRADKRPNNEKLVEEKAFGGERISITFRQIGTFMDEKEQYIWGAGAKGKPRHEAGRISKDDTEMEAMIDAFGKENHDADFDWDVEYGRGFDVVNLVIKKAKLYLCSDDVANQRVQLSLCEKSIPYQKIEREDSGMHEQSTARFHTWMHGLSNSNDPLFKEADDGTSGVEGDLTIMMYLEQQHPFLASSDSLPDPSQSPEVSIHTQLAHSNELLFTWRELRDLRKGGASSPPTTRYRLEEPTASINLLHEELHIMLNQWEMQAGASKYIAEDFWTITDCAFWPVLHHLVSASEELNTERYPHLLAYHKRVLGRGCVRNILGAGR
ncbi:hypothetical protein ACLMJK_009685 [Lecanora helva]